MKKLLYTLFIFSASFLSVCKTSDGSKITEEAKAISQCGEKLSEEKSADIINCEESKTPEIDQEVSSVVPGYLWDTKMMIW